MKYLPVSVEKGYLYDSAITPGKAAPGIAPGIGHFIVGGRCHGKGSVGEKKESRCLNRIPLILSRLIINIARSKSCNLLEMETRISRYRYASLR